MGVHGRGRCSCRPSRSKCSTAIPPPCKNIETRLLTHQAGEWFGYSLHRLERRPDRARGSSAKRGNNANCESATPPLRRANPKATNLAVSQPGRVHGVPLPGRQFRARRVHIAHESHRRQEGTRTAGSNQLRLLERGRLFPAGPRRSARRASQAGEPLRTQGRPGSARAVLPARQLFPMPRRRRGGQRADGAGIHNRARQDERHRRRASAGDFWNSGRRTNRAGGSLPFGDALSHFQAGGRPHAAGRLGDGRLSTAVDLFHHWIRSLPTQKGV